PSTVGSTVDSEKKEFESSKEALKKLNKPMNKKWVDVYEGHDKVVNAKKELVWKDCWEAQKDMMTWPDDLEDVWREKYPYFGDEIEIYDLNEFPKHYDRQLWEVWQVANPLSENGKTGCVQFSGG